MSDRDIDISLGLAKESDSASNSNSHTKRTPQVHHNRSQSPGEGLDEHFFWRLQEGDDAFDGFIKIETMARRKACFGEKESLFMQEVHLPMMSVSMRIYTECM